MDEEIQKMKEQLQEKDNPKKITTPFLKRKKKWWHIKERIITEKELEKEQPILLYMTEDYKIIPYKNIKTGYLKTKRKDIINKIDSVKIHELQYGKTPIKVYIQHEKELNCYPTNTEYDSKQIHDIIVGIKSNDASLKDTPWIFNLSRKQIENILLLIGGFFGIIIAVFYVGKIFGVWEMLGIFTPEETIKTAVQNLTNVTPNITNAGGKTAILK